jgi:hypothetical protein
MQSKTPIVSDDTMCRSKALFDRIVAVFVETDADPEDAVGAIVSSLAMVIYHNTSTPADRDDVVDKVVHHLYGLFQSYQQVEAEAEHRQQMN